MGCSSSVHAAPVAAQSAPSGEKPQPVTPDSRVLRGQAYYTAGKVQEALKEFNATIAQWPTYARAYLERGNVRLDQKEFNLAVGDYTLALQLQGNLLQAYVMRCHARMAMRQWVEALQDVREAERLDPENAQVRALKIQVRKAGGGGGGPGGISSGASDAASEEDAFAGVDTPKSTPSPSVKKLCMVCMDAERECRLRPCMHAALCVECAEGLMARGYGCPICSCKIEQVERGAFMRTFTVEEAQGLAASARTHGAGNTAPSPGKSPLGRRFAPPGAQGAPSLDNIAEVDEEAHAAADAAAAAAAAAAAGGERSDGGGGDAPAVASTRPDPPVQLNPHPLAARANTATRNIAAELEQAAPAPSGPGRGNSGDQAAPPPPLPGVVEDGSEGVEASSGSPRTTAAADGSADGDGGSSVAGGGAVLSPGTSAMLANSLADWMDSHNGTGEGLGGTGGSTASAASAGGVRAPGAAAPPPAQRRSSSSNNGRGSAQAAAAVQGAASGAGPEPGEGGSRRGGSFAGFVPPPAAAAAAATAPGPVAEGCCAVLRSFEEEASASARQWETGSAAGCGAGLGSVRQLSARALAAAAPPTTGMRHLTAGANACAAFKSSARRAVAPQLRNGWCGVEGATVVTA
ncbi:hypothetical protein HXX76_003214 [Chlamydomonas incerta]|uniref:RING-type domain-containing protein n=1 Tax=Chlamydomonas incerta TaxID=51695 RepID=A0A835TAG8_CHLIN|nr:hypothetical protein HXX76_003214 [Chlamydomonas incerta]|eukprot:KAG2441593.1 hypothetical protein HXX76_003214 [Chlamydomonas incerta]